MTSDPSKLKEVTANIRSVLTSTKGKIGVRDLDRDFQMLIGHRIPFRDFGHGNLEQFISSIPSLVTSHGPNGLLVDAKPNEQTAHIASMVNAQKTTKKKSRFSGTSRRPSNRPANRRPAAQQTWHPPRRSNAVNHTPERKPMQTVSNRLSMATHSQFLELPNTPPRRRPAVQIQQRPVRQPLLPTPIQPLMQQVISPPVAAQHAHGSVFARLSKRPETSGSATAATVTPPANGRYVNVANSSSGSGSTVVSPNTLRLQSVANLDLSQPVWNWSSDESSPLTVNGAPTVHSNGVALREKGATYKASGNHFTDLMNFVQYNKLDPPDVKVIPRKLKQRSVLYDCKIKICKLSFSSYPKDCLTEDSAKSEAARLALADLEPKFGRRQSLLLSTEMDILERIPPMVEKHFAGLFNLQLELDYIDGYNEQLPANWLEIIDMLDCISVEPSLENKFILRYCKPGEKGRSFTPLASNVSVPSNTIKATEEFFLVEVMCPMSIGEIWCRQLDTPAAETFDKMLSAFEEFYEKSGQTAATINIGGFYVGRVDGTSHRVRVLEFVDNEVLCFLIDSGDEVFIAKNNIYYLQRQFAREQQQAFVVQLDGLEDLSDVSKTSAELGNLFGKQVLIKPVIKTTDDDTNTDNPEPILTVVMYDPVEQTYINEILLTKLSIEASVPLLNTNGIVTEVYVVHAEGSGDLYVQTRPAGYAQFECLLEALENEIISSPPTCVAPTGIEPKNTLYIVKFKENDRWYRVKLLDFSPCKRFVQVYFVDFGNTEVKSLKSDKIYCLEQLSPTLCLFAEQAIHVRMSLSSVPSNFVQSVETYMPDDVPVLMKVLKHVNVDNATVPCVEFYKRSDSCLFSINRSLSLESEISPSIGDGNNNAKSDVSTKMKILRSFKESEEAPISPIPSSGQLRAPKFPAVGEYFDVKIPCAVNPWNFFIQPLDSHGQLITLMCTMQERYSHITHSPLHIEDIQPGKIYASRHEDGQWYRTCVMKVIHSGSISVFYCDFGFYASLTINQLFPLDPDLMQLAYQAIKAKVAGIKPKNDKWSVEDCDFFEKLVKLKTFVSVIAAIGQDELYRCDTVLHLRLVDTSTTVDSYVDNVLVNEGIAVFIQ